MRWWKRPLGEQPNANEKPTSHSAAKPEVSKPQTVSGTVVRASRPHEVKNNPELLVRFFPFNGYDAGIAAQWLVEEHAEWLEQNLSNITDEFLLTSLASTCGNRLELGLAALDRCKAPPLQNLVDVVANAFSLSVRSHALDLLKSSTYPYFEVLAQFLEKPKGTVTFGNVSECLARAHDLRVFGPLVDILTPWLEGKPHHQPIILADAAKALGYLGDMRAVDILIQVLQSDEEPMGSVSHDEHTDHVRKAAAEALAMIGDKRAIPAPIKEHLKAGSSVPYLPI